MIKTDYNYSELQLEEKLIEGQDKGSKAKDVFCTHWDNARTGLTTLHFLLSKKWMASFVIGLVISIGDNIQAKFCKK